MMPRERNSAWIEIVLLALAPLAGAALVASFAWDVEAMGAGGPWRVLGLVPQVCPGCAACGLSRAFSALSHGELARALHFNASVAALYPLAWCVAFAGPALAARRLFERRSPCRPLPS